MRQSNFHSQKGVALLVVLVLVMAFSASLVAIARFSATDINTKKARLAADEIYALSKASRVYVRDLIATTPGLKATLATTPTLLSIDEMITRRLLPPDFATRAGTATHYTNALGQRMAVILANNPINGNPTLSSTVPAGYLFVSPPPTSRFTAIQAERLATVTAQRLKELNLPVNAPSYDETGQILVSCGGTATPNAFVGSWDTGCLSAADYAVFRTVDATLPQISAFQGAMVIPTWRSFNGDPRALLRFAQPENAGATTMGTDLYMARAGVGSSPCGADLQETTTLDNTTNADGTARVKTETLDIDSATAGVQTLCEVTNDTAITDNRYDIKNASALTGNALVVERQAARFGGDALPLSLDGVTPLTARITGTTTVGGNTLISNKKTAVGIPPAVLTINTPETTLSNTLTVNHPSASSALSVSGDASVGHLKTDRVSAISANATGTPTNGTLANVTAQSGNINAIGANTADTNMITNVMRISAANVETASVSTLAPIAAPSTYIRPTSTSYDWGVVGLNNDSAIVGVVDGTSIAQVYGTTNVQSGTKSSVRMTTGSAATINRIDTQICVLTSGGQCPSGRGAQVCEPDPSTGIVVCRPAGGI